MDLNNLSDHQLKTVNRFKMVREGVDILELFFELGFRNKRNVYMQLCVAYPKYNTPAWENHFNLFWGCRIMKKELMVDLQNTIDKINSK